MDIPRVILITSILSILLSCTLSSRTINNSEILYLSPVPNSKYNTKETNIILKFKDEINTSSVSVSNFNILGSSSGKNIIKVIWTDEKNTVILKPVNNFSPGEEVRVKILNGITSANGKAVTPFDFSFEISRFSKKQGDNSNPPYWDEFKKNENRFTRNNFDYSISPVFQSDSIPSDFPQIRIIRKYDTAPGYIFISNFRFDMTPISYYLMVLDNSGNPIIYKNTVAPCFDFKAQNDSTFSYFDGRKFFSTNTSLQILDSFYCGNGYSTDIHELQLLPNNHAYLMSYDSEYVDMSQVVAGGDPNAVVSGLIVQEIDQNKNVIFQWRSWDHFQITDATHENLQAHNIDYVHGNAIDLDYDGNVIISSRHMDEITKINRQTGDIIWRWGGKNNQFNFVNDPIKFSHQHCIRRLANGNYTLFDNGNFHSPPFSRGCEYKLDVMHKTATLVWEYRDPEGFYGLAMGSVQRLSNGNTFIGWGSTNPTCSEIRPNGTKTFEMTLPQGSYSYRAFRQTWKGAPVQPLPSNYSLLQNFPNPFNPITTIKYQISEDSYVTLKIYDILGREVRTLVAENQKADTYLIDFNTTGLASGVYFYKLTANGFTDTKKMILVK